MRSSHAISSRLLDLDLDLPHSHPQDFSGIMLLYAAQGNRQGLATLATQASRGGIHNKIPNDICYTLP